MDKLKKYLFSDATLEALKDLARTVYFAAYPIVLMGINQETGVIAINWLVIKVVIIAAVLKSIDKWMHEWGKKIDNESLTKGLSRF